MTGAGRADLIRPRTRRGRLVVALVALVVVAAATTAYLVIRSIPDYRIAFLVDASAGPPGAASGGDFRAISGSVGVAALNAGDHDALSLRRFGGACGDPHNTAELVGSGTGHGQKISAAVHALTPHGATTLHSGILAAIDDFSGRFPFRGRKSNRIIVVTGHGGDACTGTPAVTAAIRDRLRAAGLRLDFRFVGYKVPAAERGALSQIASASGSPESPAFPQTPADLTATLKKLTIPAALEAKPVDPLAAGPRLAYATTTAVRIGSPTGASRGLAAVPAGMPVRKLVWSQDGRRLGWLAAQGNGGSSRVYLAEIPPAGAAPTVHSWACQCRSIGFQGSTLVSDELSANAAPHLLGYPMTGGPPTRIEVTGLPARSGYLTPPAFSLQAASGAPDGVIVGYSVPGASAYAGPQRLYRLSPAGRATSLILDKTNTIPRAFGYSPDRKLLGYVATAHGGTCSNYDSVVIVDIGTKRVTSPVMPTSAGDRPWYARAVWFDDHDTAYAALLPLKSCTAATQSTRPTIYRNTGGHWVPTRQSGLYGAYTPDGAHATILGAVSANAIGIGEDSPGGGTLVAAREKTTTTVGAHVTAFAWAPT